MSEVVYCYLRGQNVSVEECTTSCGAPDMRPQCWADKGISESFEGGAYDPIAVIGTDLLFMVEHMDSWIHDHGGTFSIARDRTGQRIEVIYYHDVRLGRQRKPLIGVGASLKEALENIQPWLVEA